MFLDHAHAVNLCTLCDILVEAVREKMKGLRRRFTSIRKSTIECLEKCQVAAMTVLTLLSSIFGFDVQFWISTKRISEKSKVNRSSLDT